MAGDAVEDRFAGFANVSGSTFRGALREVGSIVVGARWPAVASCHVTRGETRTGARD